MILIIDNYDSFTYNLYQQIEALGKKTLIFQHDKISLEKIKKLKPEKIIISPGPKRPEGAGISKAVVQEFYTKIPILGVCLGHECIGQFFGSRVIHAKKIYHGKTSKIYHDKSKLFQKIPNPFIAARYHSLVLDKVPTGFKLTAWTSNKEIMAIEHDKYPLFGIQFHTESFLTDQGDKLIHNFLYAIWFNRKIFETTKFKQKHLLFTFRKSGQKHSCVQFNRKIFRQKPERIEGIH